MPRSGLARVRLHLGWPSLAIRVGVHCVQQDYNAGHGCGQDVYEGASRLVLGNKGTHYGALTINAAGIIGRNYTLLPRGDVRTAFLARQFAIECRMMAHRSFERGLWARKDYDDRRRRQAQGQAKAKAGGRYKGRPEDTERNAGIASLLAEGRSWSFIQDMTGCSRATVAKIAKGIAAPEMVG